MVDKNVCRLCQKFRTHHIFNNELSQPSLSRQRRSFNLETTMRKTVVC